MARRSRISNLLDAFFDVNTRVNNPSAPDIKPTDIVASPKPADDPAFQRELKMRPLQMGRQTQPSNVNFFGNVKSAGLGYFWLPKKEPQTVAIEDLISGNMSPGALLNIMIDVSPDVSKALWNRLRIRGTNVTFRAVDDEGKDDLRGQKAIDECLRNINPFYGGWKNLLSTMQLSIYLYGALATDSEIMLDLSGTADLFTVLPDTIWFMRDELQKPIPFQLQYWWGSQDVGGMATDTYGQASLPYRRLNTTSFKYTPFDPSVDDVYGRGPYWPVLQVVFFYAQLLRDLQRVVENQAWPHTDFKLEWEVLSKMMERIAPQALNSSDRFNAFIAEQITLIQQQYNGLSAQDAFIHPSYLEVEQGTSGARLFDVPAVVNIVRQQMIQGLKEAAFMMDAKETQSEAAAATDFEVYIHGVDRIGDICADHIIWHLQLNNFMKGINTNVIAAWEPIRTTQRLQDAQAHKIEIENAINKEIAGHHDHDAAAQETTGTKAVKEMDWEHYAPDRGPGTGETPKGEDKNTGQNTNKGSTKAKNAR